jgi:hypothetical protein
MRNDIMIVTIIHVVLKEYYIIIFSQSDVKSCSLIWM